MSNLRMSATERLEQLRDVVAAHDRAPSRRTGQQEERSLGEWVAKHQKSETPTGDAVRELLDSGTMTGPVNDLEDYQKFCTKHMRAPMPGTNVEREQALWEWAKGQQDPATLAKTYRRPPSPESKDRHEKTLAAWVRVKVASKSYLAREIEVIYRTHRADQHHAHRIAFGWLNGLVAFIATTGRAPRIDSPNDREVTLAKWAAEHSRYPERTYAAQVTRVLAAAGQR